MQLISRITSLEASYPTQIGFFYAFLSQVAYLVGHFFVQKVSKHVTPIQVLYLIGLQVCTYNHFTVNHMKLSTYSNDTKLTKMFVFRAIIGFSGACFNLTGLAMMILSEAVVIQMTAPVLTGLLAICFLKEKYDLTLLMTTVFSFVGVIFLSQPEFLFGNSTSSGESSLKTAGIIVNLIGSLLTAVTQITVKKLGSVSNPYTTGYYYGFGLAIGGPVLQIFQGIKDPQASDLFWSIFVGITRYFAHVFMNKSYALGEANKISLMAYLQVPMAYIVDIFILGIDVDFYSIVGSISIFSCVFITLYKNYKRSHQR